MKKYTTALTPLLACVFLAACGDKTEQEGPWIGIAPGSDLTAVTERTEYYDLAVETEEVFDLGLWEKNPEEYYAGDIEIFGLTIYNLLGTQFAMGEPAQLWSKQSPDGVDIYLYRRTEAGSCCCQGFLMLTEPLQMPDTRDMRTGIGTATFTVQLIQRLTENSSM